MRWSFPFGTVLGTQIRLHATLLLLAAWVVFEVMAAGFSALQAAEQVWHLVLIFVCVLLHEFGHILAARRYGIRTPVVYLSPIGGLAQLERIPKRPSEEAWMTIAGPLVNLAIAVLLTPFLPAEQWFIWSPLEAAPDLLSLLRGWNVIMLLFNLLPLFPMDGGRLLRALLHAGIGDYARATQIALRVSQVLIISLVLGLSWLGYPISGLQLVLAVFLFSAASAEAQASLRQTGVLSSDHPSP
jgi:Zn-dependent protease